MEVLALFGLILLFLFLAAPFIAFSARSKATQALEEIKKQNAIIELLRSDVERLRTGAAFPAEPVPSPVDSAEGVIDAPPEEFVASPDVSTPPEPAPIAETVTARVETETIASPAIEEPIAAERVDESAVIAPAEETMRVADDAPPTESPPPEPAKARDLEESIGSKWAVWVGGVALALGGLFLVRYSIEAGFFGPGVRLLLGAAFSVTAGVASEYVRRGDLRFSLGRLPPTQIPAILAGVSVLSGFAVVFAAHAIYGFIGPTLAFTLMGAIGLGAMAVSLLYGPAFGLFGLVGSYVTPLLVSSSAPAFGALSLFLAVVTGSAFLLHGRRPNRLVTLGAVAGHGGWTYLIAAVEQGGGWTAFLLIVGAIFALAFLKEWPARQPSKKKTLRAQILETFDLPAFAAIAVPLVLSGVIWVAHGSPWSALHLAIVVTVAVAIITAVRHADLATLAPLAGAASAGMILLWPTLIAALGVSPQIVLDVIRLSLDVNAGRGIVPTAILFAIIAGALPFLALWKRHRAGDADVAARGSLAFASALAPVCLLLAVALRVNGFNRSTWLALIALALTIALFAASELVLAVERERTRARNNPLAFIGSAAYAASAAIALGLAIAFALRETWLVVGFAVASLGVAIVATVRPIPLLRSMSAALATAAFGRFLWQPFLHDVGSWPVLNWLIVAYALPALCFFAAALLLRDRRDRPLRVHEALAAIFGAAFVLLEVRQYFAGANLVPNVEEALQAHYVGVSRNRLFEQVATQIVALGGVAMALQMLAHRYGGRIYPFFATLAVTALFILAIAGLGGAFNPLFDGTSVTGWPILNRLLWGYVLVGALLGAMAFFLKKKQGRSRITDGLEAVAAVLIALGAVLIVRHAFAGPELAAGSEYGVGFFEAVMVTIVLLALACAGRLWLEAGGGAMLQFIVRGLALIAIAWAALILGVKRNPMEDMSGVFGVVVFNRILWGYGAVAAAFAAAAVWMQGALDGVARAFRISSAIAALLGGFLLMRHGFHGPLLYSDEPVTLAEAGWYSIMAFAAAMVLSIAGAVSVMDRRATVAPEGTAVVACAFFALMCGVVANPFVTGAPLAGPPILDNALIGYLLPAVMAFVAARWCRSHLASPVARRIYGVTAIAGGLVYLVIEVRRWFVGPDLDAFSRSGTELYAYSAVVILYGVGLLALGFRLGSKDLRLASLIVVALAVCKVFLIDMAGLEGLLRALSFIGLGVSLVGIGLAYQRLLQREALRPQPTTQSSS